MLCNIRLSFIHMHKNREGDHISSILAFLPFPSTFPQHNTMEPMKRMAAGSAWDHLPKEIISLITVKVS
jgi:hypothetical protein